MSFIDQRYRDLMSQLVNYWTLYFVSYWCFVCVAFLLFQTLQNEIVRWNLSVNHVYTRSFHWLKSITPIWIDICPNWNPFRFLNIALDVFIRYVHAKYGNTIGFDPFVKLMNEEITPGASFNIHIFFFQTLVQINLSHIREECKNKKKLNSSLTHSA